MILLLIMLTLMAAIPAVIIFLVVRERFRHSDILLSFLFFICCIYYGLSRDFDVFFLGFFVLTCLFFTSVAVIIYKFQHNKSIRNLLISVILIILAPIATIISSKFYPYEAFYQWALFNPDLFIEAKGEEGFLHEIDAWGWGGMDSSLMLAPSQDYNLTVSNDLELWKAKNGIVCDIARVYKVYPKIYTIFPYTNEDCYKKSDLNK
ncbi:unnamed protein product [Commensalibacter communis]|uniref:hypothetical protein n=1 Tax=Commensalibacter communis TaxID=2972786 RepID=UPI0022FF9312|nr:hypothetical protein [Commensalibacter communis]CAI3933590.1 unnamed protein product [Commensalibacter communis]